MSRRERGKLRSEHAATPCSRTACRWMLLPVSSLLPAPPLLLTVVLTPRVGPLSRTHSPSQTFARCRGRLLSHRCELQPVSKRRRAGEREREKCKTRQEKRQPHAIQAHTHRNRHMDGHRKGKGLFFAVFSALRVFPAVQGRDCEQKVTDGTAAKNLFVQSRFSPNYWERSL